MLFDPYEMAVALNNVGVELLLRHCSDDASKCFREALLLIKLLFDSHEPNASLDERIICVEANKWLHVASQKLAKEISPGLPNNNGIMVQCYSDNTFIQDNVILDETITIDPTVYSAIAIRIDHQDRDVESINLELDSAIILHNYSIAWVYLSMTSISFQFAKMSYNVITNQSCTIHSRLNWNHRTLRLSMLVLQHTIQVCLLLHKFKEAELHEKLVDKIRIKYKESIIQLDIEFHYRKGAPAA
jgi:hypothetical protein